MGEEIDKVPTRLVLSQNKLCSVRSELQLIKLLAKGIPMITPKQLRLLTRLLVIFHKLIIKPYC